MTYSYSLAAFLRRCIHQPVSPAEASTAIVMTPAPIYGSALAESSPGPSAPESFSPSVDGTNFATGTMVGSGVRVGKGVAVGGIGVTVCVGVGVTVGVDVAVKVGVGDGVSVDVAVADAVGVWVNGMGEGVWVGGLRVGVGEGTGVTVAAGWLGSGHRPTASRKTQS